MYGIYANTVCKRDMFQFRDKRRRKFGVGVEKYLRILYSVFRKIFKSLFRFERIKAGCRDAYHFANTVLYNKFYIFCRQKSFTVLVF